MITEEEGEDIDDEIEANMMLLATKLKRKNILTKTVELKFRTLCELTFKLKVNLGKTVEQVLDDVNAVRAEKRNEAVLTPADRLELNGTLMTGILKNYDLKTGDEIVYYRTGDARCILIEE